LEHRKENTIFQWDIQSALLLVALASKEKLLSMKIGGGSIMLVDIKIVLQELNGIETSVQIQLVAQEIVLLMESLLKIGIILMVFIK
jgi:hypothetical protein